MGSSSYISEFSCGRLVGLQPRLGSHDNSVSFAVLLQCALDRKRYWIIMWAKYWLLGSTQVQPSDGPLVVGSRTRLTWCNAVSHFTVSLAKPQKGLKGTPAHHSGQKSQILELFQQQTKKSVFVFILYFHIKVPKDPSWQNSYHGALTLVSNY